MSDVPQGEQPPKITEENEQVIEKEENEQVIEKEEGSQASDQPPRSTPEKSSASTAAASDPSTKSTPDKSKASDEASKSTPEKPTTTPAKAVSEEGPATVPPVVSAQPPAAEPPVVSPPKAGRTPEKKPGILKNIKERCKTLLFKRESPKKQDSVPFVPEGSGGMEAGASSSAAATSAKPAPAAKKSKRERKGSLYVDSPMSESRTLITELEASSSSGTDFPLSEDDRKASIASSDTGAHISMLPNLEDAGSSKEAEEAEEEMEAEKEEEMEVDKGDASPDQPMEDEQ